MEGLCLSSKKLELCCDRVSFFGAVYSRDGVEPDPKKIQGIEEMTPPETKQQLQSFLGHGHIHGELHASSEPPHRATETAVEKRHCILLG